MTNLPSLYALEVLLRMYYSPYAHPDEFDGSLAWAKARDWLKAEGLIDRDYTNSNRTWMTTTRARVYIEALREVPLPEQDWVMPHHVIGTKHFLSSEKST